MILHSNIFRFGATLVLAGLYSALRTTDISTLVKPLPVILWAVIVLYSPKRPEGRWVLASLCAAFIGDILLDLGEDWLIIATVPFLGSTLLLAVAFHIRSEAKISDVLRIRELALLIPLILAATMFYHATAPHMEASARLIGSVLITISVLLLWRAVSVAVTKTSANDPAFLRWAGFIGACGIVANYLLYSVNLTGHAVPRDLVIQVYYWGQAFAAWSFLRGRAELHSS
jgi:hypothetical protein